MSIQILDPLSDLRWDKVVNSHPAASVFHTRAWLSALQRTYGYKPLVLTTAKPGEDLTDALVMCRVSSWMTGTRLVSVPFADHCDPLLNVPGRLGEFLDSLRPECARRGWKYIELRPIAADHDIGSSLPADRSFCFHELDLTPSIDHLFARLHKNSFHRKIRRAEREGIQYEAGSSRKLVDEFYTLTVATRRRQRLLPQPRVWFRNLAESMGSSLQIRLARKNGVAIAGVLTLQHGRTMMFKYGSSLDRFHNIGGMPFLFWKMIQESKAAGLSRIDLGRSDLDNLGLIQFKNRLGALPRTVTYYRYTFAATSSGFRRLLGVPGIVFRMPDLFLATAGRMMYRHLG